jgi:hypothetical protein
LGSGVDFTYMSTSFYIRRSQKFKKTVKLSVSFCALGSAQVNATRKMLVKSTPGVNFINIYVRDFCTNVFALLFSTYILAL